MLKQINNTFFTEQISSKLRFANEKKFYLRKVLYELNRLSYDKGTRKGDYLIREKIKHIDDELELLDGRIKAFEAESINASLFKDILNFFEGRFLDNFILFEKIELLKDELVNQENVDLKHNLIHIDKDYERSVKNTFRLELEKDISIFINAITSKIIPNLTGLLLEINNLIFIKEIYQKIELWSQDDSLNESDQIFNNFINSIIFFIKIFAKINKSKITQEMVMNQILSIFTWMNFDKILEVKKIDKKIIRRIINECISLFIKETDSIESTSSEKKITQEQTIDLIIKRDLQEIINKLYELEKFERIGTSGITEKGENLAANRAIRYQFHSPDSNKISLKDISEYLKDSLIFINEWLFTEIKKNPDIINQLTLLIKCIPLEEKFFNIYKNALVISGYDKNKKINILGELKQYITKDLAKDLISVINRLCSELKDTFLKISLEIDLDNNPESKLLGKKLNIIYDSFSAPLVKITIGLANLK